MNKPWEEPMLLDAKLKDSNFTLKWCHKEKMDKRRAEGWVPVSYKELSNMSNLTIEDGKSLDSTVQVRELVLCKLPKDRKEERDKYYRDMANEFFRADRDEFLRNSGSGYIDKRENIVIK